MTPQKGTPSGVLKTAGEEFPTDRLRVTLALRAIPPRRCRGRQAIFLNAFQSTANLARAAWVAKIGRRRHYHWMEKDPAYRELFTQIRMEVHDELQDEAVRRAKGGWLEPIFYQGIQIGTRRRYSDRLMIFLLQALLPEKYG